MISEGMSACASDRCQTVVAKKLRAIVLGDCRIEWAEADGCPKVHAFVTLMQQNRTPTGSNNQIKTDAKISLQLQSEAGPVFGKSRTVGATGRHCPVSHFIGAITDVPA